MGFKIYIIFIKVTWDFIKNTKLGWDLPSIQIPFVLFWDLKKNEFLLIFKFGSVLVCLFDWLIGLLFRFFYETGSHMAEDGLKLLIFLSLPLGCKELQMKQEDTVGHSRQWVEKDSSLTNLHEHASCEQTQEMTSQERHHCDVIEWRRGWGGVGLRWVFLLELSALQSAGVSKRSRV